MTAPYITTLSGTARNGQEVTYTVGRLTIVHGPSGAGKTRLLNLATLAIRGEADDVRGRSASTRAVKDLNALTSASGLSAQATYTDGIVDRYGVGNEADYRWSGGADDLLLPIRAVWDGFYKDPEDMMFWYLPHMEAAAPLTWKGLLSAWAPLCVSGDIRSVSLLGITQLKELEPGVAINLLDDQTWELPKHLTPLQALLAAVAHAQTAVKTTSLELRAANTLLDRLRSETKGQEPTEDEIYQMSLQVSRLEQRIQQYHAAQQQQARAQERVNADAELGQLEAALHQWDTWLDTISQNFGTPEQVRVREAVLTTQQALAVHGASQCATCGSGINPQIIAGYAAQANVLLEPLRTARAQHQQATGEMKKRISMLRHQQQTALLEGVATPQPPVELAALSLSQLQEAHQRDSDALAAMRATATGQENLRATNKLAVRLKTDLARYKSALALIQSIVWSQVHSGRDRFIARVNQYLPAGFRVYLDLGTATHPDFTFSLEAPPDGEQTTSLTGGRRTALTYAIACAICAQDPKRRYRLLVPCADTGISGDLLGEMARALRAAPEWIQIILVSTDEPAGRITDWTVLALGEKKKKRGGKTPQTPTTEAPPQLLDTTPAGEISGSAEAPPLDITTTTGIGLESEDEILAFIRMDPALAALSQASSAVSDLMDPQTPDEPLVQEQEVELRREGHEEPYSESPGEEDWDFWGDGCPNDD